MKGVQYVDEGGDVADPSLLPDQHGHPTWRIENRNETQSEIHIRMYMYIHNNYVFTCMYIVYVHVHIIA